MGHGSDESHGKLGTVSGLQRLHVGGLRRKELELCSMFVGMVGMVGMVGYLWPWA